MAHLLEIVSGTQARRTAADDSYLFACGLGTSWRRDKTAVGGGIAFQSPDNNGVIHNISAAFGLTRMFTDQSAGGDKRIILSDETHGVGVSSLGNQRNVSRNIYAGRT